MCHRVRRALRGRDQASNVATGLAAALVLAACGEHREIVPPAFDASVADPCADWSPPMQHDPTLAPPTASDPRCPVPERVPAFSPQCWRPPNSLEGLVSMQARATEGFIGIVRIDSIEPPRNFEARIYEASSNRFAIPALLANFEMVRSYHGTPPSQLVETLDCAITIVAAQSGDPGLYDGAAFFYGFPIITTPDGELNSSSQVDLTYACGWDGVVSLAEAEQRVQAGLRDAVCF